MASVLFVCMGNICRSPTAQGVFERLVEREGLEGEIRADSAGTGSWHVGEPPDRRAQESARRRGIDLSGQRARQLEPEDFERFDYVVVMDRENYRNVLAMCPPEHREKVRLLMEYAPETGVSEVPDPYFGGPDGFERVLDLVEEAAEGLLDEIRAGGGDDGR
ncbi:low molecular weight phosphotyrosine protein phosphatase [Rubrobacter taiwanensis]|uniref:protein-tyrosine-phosphatase n=1 Tax=Rubrobacter taiwanensis TaxID=185139 RepID=A0A4R1BLQ9_9ACTN|nr:low molecular weight protein-tyrosine-phosphatase [Rubrobacter taiwanensis]TCJ18309.1 low molecular weight phosphotyrosine protein phosphatase [Rubrobacter taiwanensis]